jgi:hypothetical protein
MSVFSRAWTSALAANLEADVLGAMTEDAINAYLKDHWKNDREKYRYSKTLNGQNKASFELEVTVDAPLRVELPPLSKDYGKYTPVTYFTEADLNIPSDSSSVRIFADTNSFTFVWTTASGKSFSHNLKNVRILLDAEVLSSIDGIQHNVKFKVLSLSIDAVSMRVINPPSGAQDLKCDEKLDTLFLSLMQVVGAEVAVRVNETIEIPALNVGTLALYPSAIVLLQKTIVIAAAGDISTTVRRIATRVKNDVERVRQAFLIDLGRAGSAEALIFSKRIVERARGLQASASLKLFTSSKVRSRRQIWADMSTTRDELALILSRSEPSVSVIRVNRSTRRRGEAGLGVAVSERLLQNLAAHSMSLTEENCTKELSVGAAKGRLCANIHVWNPTISVDDDGLTGTVDIDVWAGLQYWVKSFWDCSWTWDGPHNIGLGVIGAPKITLRTVSNHNGLSIEAHFDLSAVHLQTKVSPLLDKLLAALDPLFIAMLQVIVNAVADLMSLVVVPVRVSVPGQRTGIALSNFKTSRYVRPKGSRTAVEAKDNYLAVDCVLTPTEV